MEDFREKIIKEMEKKLGDGYRIFPKDVTKNNNLSLHGIFIHKKDESIAAVVYPDEYFIFYGAGLMTLEEIADELIQRCHTEEVPQNIADTVQNFGMAKDMVRIRMVNYAANSAELRHIPHRKFLDLAATYYIDTELAAGENAAIVISDKLLEIWDVGEEVLYRIGMENLLARDGCHTVDLRSIVREVLQEEMDREAEALFDMIEAETEINAGMYVATNKNHFHGSACLLNIPFLREFADSRGSDLIIYPASLDELLILPVRGRNRDCMDTEDIRQINMSSVPREKCLSNSIYLYDRAKQEVSVYKEGAPL